MINQKFDILNKPVLSCYNAAYLVDYKNVELHRQYVANIIVVVTYIGLILRLRNQSLMMWVMLSITVTTNCSR